MVAHGFQLAEPGPAPVQCWVLVEVEVQGRDYFLVATGTSVLELVHQSA